MAIKALVHEVNTREALQKGDAFTKLSALIFGFGNLCNRQILRGLLLLGIEVAYITYMVRFGFQAMVNMVTLGTKTQEEVFNETKQIYEYITGDNSMLCLLYGVITIFATIGFIILFKTSVKSAYKTQLLKSSGKKIPSFIDDLRSLKQEKLHIALLSTPVSGIILFTIIPLVFMILIAFTSYDKNHQPPGNLFDWVGLDNFKVMFSQGSTQSHTFWPVLEWTVVWSIFATFSSYIL
ncbi:MAG: sugar ABC transporter permease, partial [Clostridiales bacterium]|nr:sugar ABC transporter permease [Clostridiales bacterium]